MEVKIDGRQLQDVKAALIGIERGWEKATSRAINRTLSSLRTAAAREIRQEINLPHARVLKSFSMTKATAGYLSARLDSRGKPVGLASFTGTRQTQKGVSVKVLVAGKRSILKRAFIATTRHAKKTGEVSEATNVFWRRYKGPRKPLMGGAGRYARLPELYRFPLERLTGPRIQDIYAKPAVSARVMAQADVLVSGNLQHETDYILSNL